MVLLEAGDHEMLWPGVARTPKSPAGQQPRVPKWKPPLNHLELNRVERQIKGSHRICLGSGHRRSQYLA